MATLLKPILKNQTLFKTLLKPQCVSSSIISRTLTSETHKKPLSILFEEAVGLRPKSETTEIEEGEEGNELKRKLLELERKLIELKKSEPARKKKQKGKVVTSEQTEKRHNLYKLFKGDEEKDIKKHSSREQEDVVRVYKELPLEMVSFVKLLHKEGYLNKANFITGEKLEIGSLDEEYARAFVKFAAEKFGKDYQEIAKWLSGSDLKKIVLFGCPSLDRRAIFAAKTLRNFFDIHENNVVKIVKQFFIEMKAKSRYRNSTESITNRNPVIASITACTSQEHNPNYNSHKKITNELESSLQSEEASPPTANGKPSHSMGVFASIQIGSANPPFPAEVSPQFKCFAAPTSSNATSFFFFL